MDSAARWRSPPWPMRCGSRGPFHPPGSSADRRPAGGKVALLHPREFVGEVGMRGAIPLEAGQPGCAQFLAPLADAGTEMFAHAVGNEELGIFRPAIEALG